MDSPPPRLAGPAGPGHDCGAMGIDTTRRGFLQGLGRCRGARIDRVWSRPGGRGLAHATGEPARRRPAGDGEDDRQRQGRGARGRPRRAGPGGAARSPAAARRQVRLRARGLRRVHGAGRRRADGRLPAAGHRPRGARGRHGGGAHRRRAPASGAAGVHGRGRPAVWLLHRGLRGRGGGVRRRVAGRARRRPSPTASGSPTRCRVTCAGAGPTMRSTGRCRGRARAGSTPPTPGRPATTPARRSPARLATPSTCSSPASSSLGPCTVPTATPGSVDSTGRRPWRSRAYAGWSSSPAAARRSVTRGRRSSRSRPPISPPCARLSPRSSSTSRCCRRSSTSRRPAIPRARRSIPSGAIARSSPMPPRGRCCPSRGTATCGGR